MFANDALLFPPTQQQAYLQQAKQEDFSDLDKLQFMYKSGFDSDGRTIVVVVGCNLPSRAASLERLFLYFIHTLDPIVEREYVLVYLAANQSSANRPPFKWMRKVYTVFNRKYRKNLKQLFIIKPSHWIKLILSCFKPFVSGKFWRKVVQLPGVNDIYAYLSPTQLKFPASVLEAITQSKPLFGVPLAEALQTPDHVQSGLPIVVAQCLRHLYEHGLNIEGIFRVPGDRTVLNELRMAYDAGDKVDLDSVKDPHAVASLLKMYLRDLPEPLIPEALFEPLVATQTQIERAPQSSAAALEQVRALLEQLPAPNKQVLWHVVAFAAELARHSAQNKMSVENVSLCFGPTLMWRNNTTPDPMALLQEMASVNSLIKLLIEHRDLLPAPAAPMLFSNAQTTTSTSTPTSSCSTSSSPSSAATPSTPPKPQHKAPGPPQRPPPPAPLPLLPLPPTTNTTNTTQAAPTPAK